MKRAFAFILPLILLSEVEVLHLTANKFESFPKVAITGSAHVTLDGTIPNYTDAHHIFSTIIIVVALFLIAFGFFEFLLSSYSARKRIVIRRIQPTSKPMKV